MHKQTIIFKKQLFGKWRRDDGEVRKLVEEAAVFREITELVNDGWSVDIVGVTIVREIVATKYDSSIDTIKDSSEGATRSLPPSSTHSLPMHQSLDD